MNEKEAKILAVISWGFVALCLVVGLENLFAQPEIPERFIAGADLITALLLAIVLLAQAHVFDVRK